MSAAVDQKQFFRDLYASIETNCTEAQLDSFGHLSTDEERFRFVHTLPGIEKFAELRPQPSSSSSSSIDAAATDGKNADAAAALKLDGNAAFGRQNFADAVRLYGEALLLTPPAANGGADVAIVLANRSAALSHLQQYDRALADIELAFPAYPTGMLYKLTERKARCLLAKEEFAEALLWFRKTVTALDTADVPLERREKLEKNAQIMIKMLPMQIAAAQRNPLPPTSAQRLAAAQKGRPERDTAHSQLRPGVRFERTAAAGRYAVASEPIDIGERVLTELPHCAVLLETFARTHCAHCFRRAGAALLACAGCADAVFCSAACLRTATDSYHRYECGGMLRLLWASGTSVTCHMAYRAVAQQSLAYFRGVHAELVESGGSEEARARFEHEALRLPAADYRRVWHLERHERVRGTKSHLNYAAMAYFLTHCLRVGGFFGGGDGAASPEDFDFVGALVLRNLQIVQFNSHEVYELTRAGDRTVFLGGGLYPTLALFNHSCSPDIVRYYKGTAVFVHAITNIRAGAPIAENYGPLFAQDAREERQRLLRSQYWFDCACEPCRDGWPVFNRMRTDELRFRCDSDRPCTNVLVIPVATDAFMVKCDRCGQFTNILKGLKAVQDTDAVGRAARRHEQAGEWRLAILKYIEMVNIMDRALAPPFADYCKAQQSIKDCLLRFGNREV